MKIAIFGASGIVGRAITKAALQAGYDVTVLTRNASNIKENDKKTPRSDGRCYRPGDFTRRHKR